MATRFDEALLEQRRLHDEKIRKRQDESRRNIADRRRAHNNKMAKEAEVHTQCLQYLEDASAAAQRGYDMVEQVKARRVAKSRQSCITAAAEGLDAFDTHLKSLGLGNPSYENSIAPILTAEEITSKVDAAAKDWKASSEAMMERISAFAKEEARYRTLRSKRDLRLAADAMHVCSNAVTMESLDTLVDELFLESVAERQVADAIAAKRGMRTVAARLREADYVARKSLRLQKTQAALETFSAEAPSLLQRRNAEAARLGRELKAARSLKASKAYLDTLGHCSQLVSAMVNLATMVAEYRAGGAAGVQAVLSTSQWMMMADHCFQPGPLADAACWAVQRPVLSDALWWENPPDCPPGSMP